MPKSEQLGLDIEPVDTQIDKTRQETGPSEAECPAEPGVVRSLAGIRAAREALKNSNPEPEPDPEADVIPLRQKTPIGRFEQLAADRLGSYLYSQGVQPFFNPQDRDIIIRNHQAYFTSIREGVKPSQTGDESLSVRQARAEAQARKGKTKAYGERLVGDLGLVDSCRSWRWYLLKGEFNPVWPGDSPEAVQQRVAVGLVDMLTEARARGLVAAGHSGRVIEKFKDRFDRVGSLQAGDKRSSEEISPAVTLTVLVGKNAVLKVYSWIDQLAETSKGYRIFDPDLVDFLAGSNLVRPSEHRQHFDPLQRVLPRLKSNRSTDD